MIPTTMSSLLLLSVLSLVGFVHGQPLDMNLILYKASNNKGNDNGLYTGDPIQILKSGETYDLQVIGKELTMIAEIVDNSKIAPKNKVAYFTYDNETRIDKVYPYSLSGDTKTIGRFVRAEYLSYVGQKNITVIVYDPKNLTIAKEQIIFYLIDSGVKETINIEMFYLVQANLPKKDSLLAILSDGMTVDLVKIFEEEPDKAITYPLPLALYVKFNGVGVVPPKSVNFNFYYNSTDAILEKDSIFGTPGKENKKFTTYDILSDLMNPGYKTVTVNAYDNSSTPLIFTRTYHFTLKAHPEFKSPL